MGTLRDGSIRARILIWGPPGAGKTTTLSFVASKLKANQKGPIKKVTLKNPACNYELLPVELGDFKGVPTKLDFQSSPGAWDHAGARKRMLQGIDGIVFVANSIGSAMKDNQRALQELDDALKGYGRSLVTVPVVFQWMNQKAIGSMPPDEMQAKLNKIGAPTFAVAQDDPKMMLNAFTTISKMAVKVVREDYDAGRLAQPAAMEIDLDDFPPPPPAEKEKPAAKPPEPEPEPESDNPFADLASDLADDLGDFEPAAPAAASSRPSAASSSAAMEVEDDLDSLLSDSPLPRSEAPTRPAPMARTNGSAKFKLVHSGEPNLGDDGTLTLPIKIGNEHGEEVALTITVKVTPG